MLPADSLIHGRHYFEKKGSSATNTSYIFWDGKKWVMDINLDDTDGRPIMAYAKGHADCPSSDELRWYTQIGGAYQVNRALQLTRSTGHMTEAQQAELLGVPRRLVPYFLPFLLDAIAVGLVMPLLPYVLMELGATALQQSLIVSANYLVQMIGCLVMGKVSDMYGRKVVLLMGLGASSLSYWCISHALSLRMVLLARLISASCGGLLPVLQSCVADSTSTVDRPKYLGRIMATFGLGFVLGPAIHTALPLLTTAQKLRVAAALPLVGFLVSLAFARETRANTVGTTRSVTTGSVAAYTTIRPKWKYASTVVPPVSPKVRLLVLNGFLNMYAFGTETIYAVFLKDTFGYGESTLGALLVANGVLMGVLQVFLIKPLSKRMGQHATLALGNLLLAAGMIGLAVVRVPALHFAFFACHIIGYCIADTSLVSAVSRYSPRSAQGRDLALNQAAQACARIFSPVIAGLLYEHSKHRALLKGATTHSAWLPVGALPFVVGGVGPLLALAIPALLQSYA